MSRERKELHGTGTALGDPIEASQNRQDLGASHLLGGPYGAAVKIAGKLQGHGSSIRTLVGPHTMGSYMESYVHPYILWRYYPYYSR